MKKALPTGFNLKVVLFFMPLLIYLDKTLQILISENLCQQLLVNFFQKLRHVLVTMLLELF